MELNNPAQNYLIVFTSNYNTKQNVENGQILNDRHLVTK